MWGKFKAYGAWIIGGMLSALGMLLYAKGRSDANSSKRISDLKKDLAASKRVLEADTGLDLDDAARRERLRKAAGKLRD